MSNFIYNISEDSDFLIHHGIKGQKWGVENGPPYPLTPSKDYTASEKKANKIINKANKLVNNKYRSNYNNAYSNIKMTYKKEHKVPFGAASTMSVKYLNDNMDEKSLLKMKNKLSKLSNKYYNDKDIAKNLKQYHKELDTIIKDFDKTKMSPELAKLGRKFAQRQRGGQYYGGISGQMAMEKISDNELLKKLDSGEVKF